MKNVQTNTDKKCFRVFCVKEDEEIANSMKQKVNENATELARIEIMKRAPKVWMRDMNMYNISMNKSKECRDNAEA
ncbi:hypothetical protein CWI42_090460 [Ordospora colligata]|uniref:Uncharacterized protein n=1 Tax=Ordospora colligata OC4 TaxID=1354746 RepID=A0A0B2UJ89_9MICR|nr:uncharacterized protein M896_090460 [Ordospora colligata OC4]KHN69122.1 hypothetical protein M896_090460 [Ordospora colligata OC4]TBU14577.1 hypothetical protein CWI41_090460 [Ordospora colligata]TBU14771.1 hypothetical protein CWI40_090470 [Ordospora colligata]TBU18205.1 hypothetical protein CWI42_090460 [Ordospora colligata]